MAYEPKIHPGISVHRLPVGEGFAGILFAAASAAIFMTLPEVRGFLAITIVPGILFGANLHFWGRSSRRRDGAFRRACLPETLGRVSRGLRSRRA